MVQKAVRLVAANPRYLQQRANGVFYFRRAVPPRLVPFLGRELRWSLQTCDRKVALAKLPFAQVEAEGKLQAAEKKLRTAVGPASSSAKATHLDSQAAWGLTVEWFINRLKKNEGRMPASEEERQLIEMDLSASMELDPCASTGASISGWVRKFAQEKEMTFDDPSRELLEGLFREAMLESERRFASRFLRVDHVPENERFKSIRSDSAPPGSLLTVAELVKSYRKEVITPELAPKTREKLSAQLDVIRELLGEATPIGRIDRATAKRVRDQLEALPSNVSKRFGNQSLKQVLNLPAEARQPLISYRTAAAYIARFAALMQAAVHDQLIPSNPAQKLKPVTSSPSDCEKGEPFSTDELVAIFHSFLFQRRPEEWGGQNPPHRPLQPYRFWIPLVALFSGMRANEIGQLTADDVSVISGKDVFLVREGDDKRLKTRSSTRLVPIHPQLKRLGFLSHVATVRRDQGETARLFADLKRGSNGYHSANLSKWFARFMDAVEISRTGKNFHSLRHTFRDAMQAAGIPEEHRELISGWASDSMDGNYGGSYEARAIILSDAIAKVDYACLDLDHLFVDGCSKSDETSFPSANARR